MRRSWRLAAILLLGACGSTSSSSIDQGPTSDTDIRDTASVEVEAPRAPFLPPQLGDGSRRITWTADESAYRGAAGVIAADLDGDGRDDAFLETAGQDAGGEHEYGAYVTLDGADLRSGEIWHAGGVLTGSADEQFYWGARAGRTNGTGDTILVYARLPYSVDKYGNAIYLLDASDLSRRSDVHDVIVASWPKLVPESMGALGDVDGDGYDDVFATVYDFTDPKSPTSALAVYHGPLIGSYALSDADALWLVQQPQLAGVPGDLDGDGKRDLVVESAGYLYTVDADSHGVLSSADASLLFLAGFPPPDGNSGNCDETLRGGDLNGDGYEDLVLTCDTSFPEQGDPRPAHTQIATVFAGPVAGGRYESGNDATAFVDVPYGDEARFGAGATILDFDGDGTLDLAVGAPHAPDDPDDAVNFRGGVGVFYGPNEGGTVSWYDADTIVWGDWDHDYVAGVRGLDHADFDHDGIDDLLIGYSFTEPGTAAASIVFGGRL